MSRIRSIHPGLWTDERFVGLSPMARLFQMGVWNECDDNGIFAWSPLTLKMRILPADNADAAALLDEMLEAGTVMRFEVAGKAYGAVRNFCQYQRPKKPNSIHPMPENVGKWVNTEARSTRDGGERVPNELPTGGEKGRQMEDGGDKGKDIPPKAPRKRGDHDLIVSEWNAMADKHGLAKVEKLTPCREKALTARLKEHSAAEIREAIWEVPNNAHWMPGGDWQGTFNSFIRPGKIEGFLEAARAKPKPKEITPELLEQMAETYDRIGQQEAAQEYRQKAERMRQAA